MARTSRVEIPITATDHATRQINRVKGALLGLGRNAQTVMGTLTGFRSIAGVAGLTMLAKRSIDLGSRLDDVSKKLGVTTDFLQEFGFAARQIGVRTEAAEMGLQRFIRRVGEAQSGIGELLPVIQQYGIEMRNADGTVRSAEEILMDYAEAIKGVQSPQERLRMAFKAFDSEGAGLVSMLADGEEGLRKFREQAHQLGQVMDRDTITQLARAENEIEQFTNALTIGLGKALGALRSMATESRNAPNLQETFSEAIGDVQTKGQAEAVMVVIDDTLRTLEEARKIFDQEVPFPKRFSDSLLDLMDEFPEFKEGFTTVGETMQWLMQQYEMLQQKMGTLPDAVLPDIVAPQIPQVDLGQMARVAEMQKLTGQTEAYIQTLKGLSGAYMEKAQAELEANGITEEYLRLLRLGVGYNEEMKQTMDDLKNSAVGNLTMMSQAADIFATGLENGLVNAAAQGKSAFGDMAQFILAELQRMLIRAMLFQAFTGLGGAIGGQFGGKVQAFGQRFGNTPVSGGRAAGGPVMGGRSYMVGERGPEIVTMGANGFVTPNHKLGGPTFNVDMRGASLEAVQRLEQIVMQVNGSIEQRSVAAVQDRFSRAPSYMRR
jgi:hypothetical protein